ncbi:MAG: 4-hydroxy-tetrahydrodipicolinate reductase [Clostridia bacterium]|nr:4-hydroxy-tetrahydrodipicolinate reductase [Clostridia bacterium]
MSVKILLCGACGKMGGNVLSMLQNDENATAVCGVDLYPREIGIPVYSSFADVKESADVIIDFSSPIGLTERLEYAKEHQLGIVLASTGFTLEDLETINKYANSVAIFKTANLSLGINLMQALIKTAAEVLGDHYDVEIIERHHNLKKDAPSGTALMLADSVNEVFDGKKRYVDGRSGIVGAREKNEIGMHAVRGGTIVGEHEVMFAGEDEVITITHSASSKRVFATGAIRAAKFLAQKPAGLYDMKDLLNEENA